MHRLSYTMLLQHKLKDNRSEKQFFMQRLLIVSLGILGLFIVLAARLMYLQLFEHAKYTTLSQKNQMNVIGIPPTRGVIYDRKGVLLAENIPAYSLELSPDRIPDLTKTLSALQKIIPSIRKEDIKNFYKFKNTERPFEPVSLKLRLTSQEVARFSENQYHFSGVNVTARLIRHYPEGQATAHLLGYVARINQQELETVDHTHYNPSDFIGKIGLEKYYEKELHGLQGYKQVETDASGRIVRTLSQTPPIAGDTLYLTIDAALQKLAIQALGKNRGAVVVMNPTNGEVLALVSHPAYDPNAFVQGISSKKYLKLLNGRGHPLYNRAIRGLYPLASTVKPFIALAALSGNIVNLHYKIYDPGWYKLPISSHRYRDWKKGGHGWVNITRAITVSCDTYFFNLANLMGIKKISEVLKNFGFGAVTGIEFKEELPGLVPTSDWKRGAKGESWYPGDTIITGIGQGFLLATPVQLAQAVSSIAMHGIRYRPQVLLQYKTPAGKMILNTPTPKRSPLTEFDPKAWEEVREAMQNVITSPEGSAASRFNWGRHLSYSIAGKTGTAQVFTIKTETPIKDAALPEHLRDHTWFMAFAPALDPEIALAVIVENSHDAVLVARIVLEGYFNLKNTLPDLKPMAKIKTPL